MGSERYNWVWTWIIHGQSHDGQTKLQRSGVSYHSSD